MANLSDFQTAYTGTLAALTEKLAKLPPLKASDEQIDEAVKLLMDQIDLLGVAKKITAAQRAFEENLGVIVGAVVSPSDTEEPGASPPLEAVADDDEAFKVG